MKKMVYIFILVCFSITLPAKVVGILTEVIRPDNITVYQDKLVVMEGASVLIYNLEDLTLIRKFGKSGEGPGELKVIPGRFYNRVNLKEGYILTESVDKLIFFSHEGKLIREMRKGMFQVFKTLPVGKNYAILKQHQDSETGQALNSVILMDSEYKEIKTLYSQPFVQQGRLPNYKIQMVADFIQFQVYKDKIYVEESPRGFLIEVFDSEGNQLKVIRKQYAKIKVTGRDREYLLEKLKNDPNTRAQGGYEALKNIFQPEYAEFWPPIQNLEVSGDKIYIQTFQVQDNKEEYVILDLDGNEKRRVFIPRFENVPIMAKILGATLQTIENGKLYYVQENEDDETWELHVEEIK